MFCYMATKTLNFFCYIEQLKIEEVEEPCQENGVEDESEDENRIEYASDTKEDQDFEEFSHKDYQLSNLELVRRQNMEKNFQIFEEFQINQVGKK